MKPKRSKRRTRKGVEAVEAAIILPVIVLFIFASAQVSHYIHVQTLLKIAGSESAYAWGKSGGTREDAERVFQEHCEALGLKDCECAIHVDSLDGDHEAGEVIRFTPRAKASSNQLGLPVPVVLPKAYGYWIQCEEIQYRKEGL